MLRASSRLLFADIFGLTCWVVAGTGEGSAGSDTGAAESEVSGPRWRSGRSSALGAMIGIVNRSPKSAFCT